jgi:hypothetical protein
MRPLNDRERRTVRIAAVVLTIYLALFYGLKAVSYLEGKREEHRQLLAQAESLKLELLRERVKASRLQKLKRTFRIEPLALRRESVVGEASSAIQRAAQAQGIQVGPAREMSGRGSSKELSTIQIEGVGTTLGATQFLSSLGTLGFPLVVESIHLKTTGLKPGQVGFSLSVAVLDFAGFNLPEKSGA